LEKYSKIHFPIKCVWNRCNVDPWLIAYGLLALVYVLPIWIFTYFPSQDGPCHLYNAFILNHYDDPNYTFSQFYDIRSALIPNWTSHSLLALFMRFAGPLIAEKLLLTGYILLMATGLLYLVTAVQKDAKPLAFLGFPFIYNGLFIMGFYNYSIGIGLMLISIGYWWRNVQIIRYKTLLILGILMLLLYFTHPLALSLATFSLLMISLVNLANRSISLKEALLSFIPFVIPTALLLFHMEEGLWHWGDWTFNRLLTFFWENGSLVYHSPSQQIFARMLTWTFSALILYSLIKEHVFQKGFWFNPRRNPKDFFFFLSFAFLMFYFIFPDRMSGGAVIKGRLSYLPFLLMIPWISWDMPKIARNLVGAMLIVLSVAYLGQASVYHKRLSNELEIYMSGQDVIEPNSVILPLCFDAAGSGWLIGTFQHAVGYYGCRSGGIDLGNYEAATGHFPTVFKIGVKRPDIAAMEKNPGEFDFGRWVHQIDYIITWALPEPSETASRLNRFYEPVKHNGKLKIFRRKTLLPASKTEKQKTYTQPRN
jgi:hypothetical protein